MKTIIIATALGLSTAMVAPASATFFDTYGLSAVSSSTVTDTKSLPLGLDRTPTASIGAPKVLSDRVQTRVLESHTDGQDTFQYFRRGPNGEFILLWEN